MRGKEGAYHVPVALVMLAHTLGTCFRQSFYKVKIPQMDLGLVTSEKWEHIETCKHTYRFCMRLVAAAQTAPV